MNLVYKYLVIISLAILASSCVFHTGNVSSGSQIDCPRLHIAYGSASTTYFLGLGGFVNEALLIQAKKNLYEQFPQKKGVTLSNFSVDYQNTYLLLFYKTKITVSADVFDCNAKFNDTAKISKENFTSPLINGFRVGDSLLFRENDEFYVGIVNYHVSNDKLSIDYESNGKIKKDKKVGYNEVFKTSKDPENQYYFGFEVGDNSHSISILNSETHTRRFKKCKVLAMSKKQAYIEYTKDDGQKRKLVVDKSLLKFE